MMKTARSDSDKGFTPDIKTVAIDVQKDGFVVSKFNGQEFLIKNESGDFKDFYKSDLGKPWKQPKINLEEKFKKDFDKWANRRAIVEDVSKISGSMMATVIDRQQVKIWIDADLRDLIESIAFHSLAAIGCFGGWCLTMYLFLTIFRPG